MRVKKISNTNFISSRHVKSEKASLPVDARRSKTSLLSVVQATETLSFLFSFRGWRKDECLAISNLISLLRIPKTTVFSGGGTYRARGWGGRVRMLFKFEFQTSPFRLLRVKQGRALSLPVSVF